MTKSSKSKNPPGEQAKSDSAANDLPPHLFWMAAAALAAAILAIYSPSLSYPFILDDKPLIGDTRVQLPGHVWSYFTNAAWAQFAGGPTSFYRPLFVVWLRINFILNGASPWGWRLLSVLKHVGVAVLLAALVWVLLRDRAAALAAAGVFALHPADTESVAWVTVPDPLMACGVLASILLYLKYRDFSFPRKATPALPVDPSKDLRKKSAHKARKVVSKPAQVSKDRGSVAWLAGSATLYFAALLVKETAIVALLVLFALALAAGNSRAGLRARALLALRDISPFAAATVAYLLLRLNAMGGRLIAPTQYWPWTNVLLSWPATLWFYVKVLFWPVRFRAFGDPTRADAFSVNGVLIPAVWVCGVIAILVMAGFWAWKKARRDLPAAEASGVECALLLGALLLALPLVPALNLNALNPDDYLHGRYAYLSTAGLFLLDALGWHLAGKWRTPLFCIAGGVALALGALTLSQETAWSSDLSVFAAGHKEAPRNAFVARNLVRAQVQETLEWDTAGRCRDAMPVFENAIRQYPEDWYAWAGLGDCLDKQDDLPRAEQALRRAADLAGQELVTERWQAVREKLRDRGAQAVR